MSHDKSAINLIKKTVMTEREIFEAIDLMISCLPEDHESVIDMIRNSKEIREFVEEAVSDKIETALQKLQEILQKIANREPRIIDVKVAAPFVGEPGTMSNPRVEIVPAEKG